MTISLEQFKNNTLGGSYGNPGTGTYKGQCVSYVRQYMEQVLGVKTAAWGNAVDYWTNSDILALFDKVPAGQEQDGDILVWGDDPGNWTTQYGHIAIRYGKGKILNQNFGGSLKVSINDFFAPGYLGALRLKGTTKDMPLTEDALYMLIRGMVRREPTRDEMLNKDYYTNPELAIRTFWNNGSSKQYDQSKNPSDADKKLRAIKDALDIK